MVQSMTGYGRASVTGAVGTVTAEVKTVNSRFLEFLAKSDGLSPAAEEVFRNAVKSAISRGKVYLTLKFAAADDSGHVHVTVNEPLLGAYVETLRGVQKRKGIKTEKIRIHDLLSLPAPWLRVTADSISDEELLPLVKEAAKGAVDELISMREKEGETLAADLLRRLSFLHEQLDILKSVQDRAAKQYGERLRARIRSLMEDTGFEADEGRILEEIAIFSEKTDYTEEVVRFGSHLVQFEESLSKGGPVGRKLDFLVQELNREINTMGSKAGDIGVTDCVIAVKTELEKVREQVQNLE